MEENAATGEVIANRAGERCARQHYGPRFPGGKPNGSAMRRAHWHGFGTLARHPASRDGGPVTSPVASAPTSATTPARTGIRGFPRQLVHLTMHADFKEERFFLLLSIFIGVFSGLAVVCFRLAIDWSRVALLGPYPHPTALRLLAVPTLVGLLVAILVLHVFPAVRGSGVNQTKAALYIFNGYIPLRSAVGKFLCCALAIGSGQSLGPEDPSLQ